MSTAAAGDHGEPRRRRLVLCLDGTWNSTYTRKQRDAAHYVIKPSNVLKLARAILPRSPADQRDQIVYYDIGVGSLATYPGLANMLLRLSDKFLGGGRGAGFEGNVEDALGFITLNHLPGSRGLHLRLQPRRSNCPSRHALHRLARRPANQGRRLLLGAALSHVRRDARQHAVR